MDIARACRAALVFNRAKEVHDFVLSVFFRPLLPHTPPSQPHVLVAPSKQEKRAPKGYNATTSHEKKSFDLATKLNLHEKDSAGNTVRTLCD